ncbi:amidase [Paraburkholderia sp. RCC_158]|uniref:amidase n=1 Tax=Paraburkholderia sp. RCC_158 TaxID=3239220 RepID=UPI003523216F
MTKHQFKISASGGAHDDGQYATVLAQSAAMEAGQASSSEQVELCIARIDDPMGEGIRTFTTVWREQATDVAAAQDTLLRSGYRASPIAGIPVSIKDLLDVKGEVTRAGALALDDMPVAACDAPVVSRLRSSGAVLIGRTNMTPFAFSVVGLNSHFGTPGNPWDRDRIPGGSSSGAAVSVADGMVAVAIGSDTVGSIRVPAALCGVVGFKPTQRAVPLSGAVPLSPTLDSIGPLARSVADCAAIHAIISGEAAVPLDMIGVRGLTFGVPREIVLDDLDIEVGRAFERACALISEAGARIDLVSFKALREVDALNGNRVIQLAEAYAWHRELLERRGADYDPRISARVRSGAQILAADYLSMLSHRRRLMREFDAATSGFDALLLPTTSIIAPTFDECMAAEDAVRTKLLRNTGPFNFLDCCSISLPVHRPGEAPVGLMVAGHRDGDWQLLKIANAIESIIAGAAS